MKKIILLVITIALLTSLCACTTQEEVDAKLYNQENAHFVDIQKDQYGNVVSRSVYNRLTQQTYIYTYTYEYIDGHWQCRDTDVVVISAGGTVITGEEATE
jgi:hypothetical protein